MALTNAEAAILVTATGVFFSVLTYLGMRQRDARAELKNDTDRAKQAGVDKERLDNVVADVEQIKKVELPLVVALTNQNAVAVSGLTAAVAAQTANIGRLSELQGERTRILDRALDKLMEEK